MKAIYKCIYKYFSHSQQHCFFHFSEGITKIISNKMVPATTSLRSKNQDHLCVSIEISTVEDIFISLRWIVFFFSSVLEISLMKHICATNWVESFKHVKFCPTSFCKQIYLLVFNLHPNCYNSFLTYQEKCITMTVKGRAGYIFKVWSISQYQDGPLAIFLPGHNNPAPFLWPCHFRHLCARVLQEQLSHQILSDGPCLRFLHETQNGS